MPGIQTFGDLQKAANYVMLRNRLRPSGISAIIFGLLAILLGGPGAATSTPDLILAILGLFLFIRGIWALAAPSPMGMLMTAIGIGAVGLWNISLILEKKSGGAPVFWVVLGILQLRWAFQYYKQYQAFTALRPESPDLQSMGQIGGLLKEINFVNGAAAADIIEWRMNGAAWKGKLMDEGGLFMMNKGRAVLAVARENVDFTMGQVTEPGKPASVSVRLGTITATGTMLPGYAQRFETWKSAARTF